MAGFAGQSARTQSDKGMMSLIGGTAAERLLSTAAPDDAGADTADRYHWQSMMATADVLALYFASLTDDGTLRPGADFTVLCEHHEDWAIIRGDEAEIVSGKHREVSTAPFGTMRQLLTDGGTLHLYQRWAALQKTPRCRLVTTGGLSDMGAKTARACEKLRADRSSDDVEVLEVVEQFRSVMGAVLAVGGVRSPRESEVDVRAFLAGLTFYVGQPRRDLLPDLAATRYGLPVAARLDAAHAAEAIWQAVLALVVERMRAAGARVGGALPTPLGMVHDAPLAPRRLTLLDVDVAIRFAIRHAKGYQPLPRLILANLMAVKMVEGGCSDNAVERADDLRLRYRRYWRIRRDQPSEVDQQGRVADTLRRVIDEVTDEVYVDGARWGNTFWRSLDARFREMEGQTDTYGMSAELMLGGVSDLANTCRAWYSDRFDAKAALARLVKEREEHAS